MIHAERFSYEAIEKAIEDAEEVDERSRRGEARNVLVSLCTVESDDERDPESVARRAAEEIAEVARKVGAQRVVVYPYAHLSPQLASPSVAKLVLRRVEEQLRSMGIDVVRAPFGWYKRFELVCYGHPLSELSRSISPVTEAARRSIEKRYLVLTPDGKVFEPDKYDFSGDDEFRVLVEKEALRKELEGGVGRVHYYFKKFGFEWEPMSDQGHMRYEPHAATIFEAVERYSWIVAQSLGIPVFRVRGTNMFSLRHEPVRIHAQLFGERMYEVRMDRDRFVLRFAACHQQFSILRDWVLSYRDLPLGMFEVADSYRYEQRGEIVLGFRVRRFHMPDLHILTRDLDEACRIVLEKVMPTIKREAEKLGRRYLAIYNVTQDFFEKHRDKLLEFVKAEGRPVLIALYPAGLYYWVVNVEYVIIDEMRRPREIATWQIDVGNAKRFGIKYRDADGSEKHPVIIHTALIGSIERYIYMVFDTVAHQEKMGRAPTLPTWLSPIQVRIIPVNKQFLDYATRIALELRKKGFRVDVDDRDESLGRKIRDAGIEWIPYVVVVGEREVKTNTLNVRVRSTGVQKAMTLDELVELLEKDVEGYPRVEQTLPMYLSQRPALPYLRELATR